MTEQSLSPPAWIHKRDGRLEPFDADKISRGLFAATETLGRPDAFMARELTDGVLHFLKAECDTAIPTTAQVADLLVKIVRELGQPALAQAFDDCARRRARQENRKPAEAKVLSHPAPTAGMGPTREQIRDWISAEAATTVLRRVGQACLREFSLREVFTRDLAAAHSEGLLTLTGLEAPAELFGYHLETLLPGVRGLAHAIEEARQITGRLLAIDGLEHALARGEDGGSRSVGEAIRQLRAGLEHTGLWGVINLNCGSPPRWANDLAEGPLFGAPASAPLPVLEAVRESLLEEWGPAKETVRFDWHLSEKDFQKEGLNGLLPLVRRALNGFPLTFVFDRPRRPISLAEGLDRQHPSVLLTVGLHLPRFREQQDLQSEPESFLRKLGSLARLALSAGVQKRDYLRRHGSHRPGLTRGFLLERARLVVIPIGLEAVVREFLGRGLTTGGAALDFARQIVRRLREVLDQDGRTSHLEASLDSAPGVFLESGWLDALDSVPIEQVAGLTPWDAAAAPKQQLKAAGALHAIVERGTASILIPVNRPFTTEEAVDLLRQARHQAEVTRLRFQRLAQPRQQLTAPWEDK